MTVIKTRLHNSLSLSLSEGTVEQLMSIATESPEKLTILDIHMEQ